MLGGGVYRWHCSRGLQRLPGSGASWGRSAQGGLVPTQVGVTGLREGTEPRLPPVTSDALAARPKSLYVFPHVKLAVSPLFDRRGQG